MRTAKDVYSYYKQALEHLSNQHPHYEEVKELLTSQVIDDLNDTYSFTNRRASRA